MLRYRLVLTATAFAVAFLAIESVAFAAGGADMGWLETGVAFAWPYVKQFVFGLAMPELKPATGWWPGIIPLAGVIWLLWGNAWIRQRIHWVAYLGRVQIIPLLGVIAKLPSVLFTLWLPGGIRWVRDKVWTPLMGWGLKGFTVRQCVFGLLGAVTLAHWLGGQWASQYTHGISLWVYWIFGILGLASLLLAVVEKTLGAKAKKAMVEAAHGPLRWWFVLRHGGQTEKGEWWCTCLHLNQHEARNCSKCGRQNPHIWDCSQCKRKGIPVAEAACSACGNLQAHERQAAATRGRPLPPAPFSTTSASPTPTGRGKTSCPNCGSMEPASFSYCGKCGNSLAAPAASKRVPDEELVDILTR